MTVAFVLYPLHAVGSGCTEPECFLIGTLGWPLPLPAICAGPLVLALWILYDLRIRYIARRMAELMERRTAERSRACRREHDVLLQSIQGLMLRFHYFTETLPEDHPSRPMLRIALQRADGLIIEARNRGEELLRGPESSAMQSKREDGSLHI